MDFADSRLALPHSDDTHTCDLLAELRADPSAFGLSRDLAEAFLAADTSDDEGEEEEDGEGVVCQGEAHNAHVIAYRHVTARSARAHALQRGVDDIRAHLDGSPGCTMLGCNPEFLHVRHLWAEEADILATPSAPTPSPPLPTGTGYPHCALPWAWWPPVVGRGHSALLFIFRLYRARAAVTAQIAAAGGIDDDRGWIVDHSGHTFPTASFAAWRRSLFLTDEERKAETKVKRRAKETARQRTVRKAQRLVAPPVGKSGKRTKRPITVTPDGHAIVTLTQGYSARILAADVPLVEGFNWSVRIVKGRAPVAFRSLQRPGGSARLLFMHHVEGMTGPVEIIPPLCAADASAPAE